MTLEKNALTFGRELTYEQWESVGIELSRINQAWQWWVGDWINYGEKQYGEMYDAAEKVTGKAKQTLCDAAWVCREYETSCRHEVSFTHHREAAPLPPDERDELLEKAWKESRPASWVREQVQGKKPKKTFVERFAEQWERLGEDDREAIREFITNTE